MASVILVEKLQTIAYLKSKGEFFPTSLSELRSESCFGRGEGESLSRWVRWSGITRILSAQAISGVQVYPVRYFRVLKSVKVSAQQPHSSSTVHFLYFADVHTADFMYSGRGQTSFFTLSFLLPASSVDQRVDLTGHAVHHLGANDGRAIGGADERALDELPHVGAQVLAARQRCPHGLRVAGAEARPDGSAEFAGHTPLAVRLK